MDKRYFLTLACSFVLLSVTGQESRVELDNLTLESALTYSLAHSPTVVKQRLKSQQAGYQLEQIKREYLPDIYASSELRRNIVIPSTPIPASMINPSSPDGELMYMRFNTPWSSGAGINVAFDIFNPETAGRKLMQEKELNISRLDSRISENELRASVAQAYVDCAIARAQLEALAADTVYYASLFREAADRYRREKISLAERNSAEINYNTSLARFHQAKNILHNANVALLLQMGLEADEDNLNRIWLTDDIESLYLKMAELEPVNDVAPLSHLRQAEQVSLSEIRTRSAVLKCAPSLSLTGYYGANYFGRELKPGDPDRWFGNSFLALSLRVPISRSLSTAKEVSRLRVEEQLERENLREIKNSRLAELSKERDRVETLRETYGLKLANMNLMKQQVVAREIQFQKGYLLESEFLSEKLREQNAQQEYLQAAYDLLSACINLEKLMKN